jgi:hypothetical protein
MKTIPQMQAASVNNSPGQSNAGANGFAIGKKSAGLAKRCITKVSH